ncbi:NAD-dependent malic enzyme [Paenibacillus psychroresistens]|uniref:NAD-dependent malic enzyme n=1 Tax=Paenibacillus psychroresistens TaxID=1778678 RepID=A0A6B8RP74_9BACL|nr:NAD-dependent malic enzyme [Paenibacillus psychroresistens]QGQ97492.1 NAD-dependent malic enzyme [Paenibacillus psychroresistens]
MAANTSIIMRIELDKTTGSFAQIAGIIAQAGGDIVAVDVIRSGKNSTIRDITVDLQGLKATDISDAVKAAPGIQLINVSDPTFLAHLGGKIEVTPKMSIKTRDDLSKVYTPGVARVCMAIHENPQKAYSLTIKRNTVAVVSDGTAVLGLGDIGPEAAMPVMEGKAMLFKQFANVDAFPICLATKDTEEIIRTIKLISPAFGGINLEDISSPRCFEIEARLKQELDIPVFHDDQHGTAIVLLAGLINALKIVEKSFSEIKVVIIGIGAAGVSIIKMLQTAGVKNIIAVDREGAICSTNTYTNPVWTWVSENTNAGSVEGSLSDVIEGADVFIGVSGKDVLKVSDIKLMAQEPIVFAMANPDPEIEPDLAEPYVRVLATGRSDYPNQINNVLCFPGIFRGALDCRAKTINEEMKLAAAQAIASSVNDEELNEQYIIPSVFNDQVVPLVRKAVIAAAIETGVARRIPPEFR